MIAYLFQTSDGITDGVVLVDSDTADATRGKAALAFYREQTGITEPLGISAIFEGVTLFKMPAAGVEGER